MAFRSVYQNMAEPLKSAGVDPFSVPAGDAARSTVEMNRNYSPPYILATQSLLLGLWRPFNTPLRTFAQTVKCSIKLTTVHLSLSTLWHLNYMLRLKRVKNTALPVSSKTRNNSSTSPSSNKREMNECVPASPQFLTAAAFVDRGQLDRQLLV